MAQNRGQFKNGHKKLAGCGRKKGTPNKVTGALKEMILGALADAGGRKYLADQARENPPAFLSLLGKVLPTTLTGAGDTPLVPKEIVMRVVGGRDSA